MPSVNQEKRLNKDVVRGLLTSPTTLNAMKEQSACVFIAEPPSIVRFMKIIMVPSLETMRGRNFIFTI